MPASGTPGLPAPTLRPLGPPLRLERSPEYGVRGAWRRRYRAGSLRGTPLDGAPTARLDAWVRDAWERWGRAQHQEVRVTVLPDGDYQVDILDREAPVPDRAGFAAAYGPQRDTLRGSLRLLLGVTHGGAPLLSDADAWPHAIIGGSSGGGKSVFVASLLAQVADRPPALVRLALGDLAGADLGPFARLPHAIGPLADDLPTTLALFRRVEAELALRQALLTAPVHVRRSHGPVQEIEDGVPNLDTWNALVTRLGRADLALPRVLVVVDEWKQAMDGSDAATELAALAARVMRVGRKWGGRVWLIAQEPKKGQGRDVTFPSDILANADTRIVLAKGGTDLLWRLMLGDAASFSADRARLVGSAGDIVQGRGVVRVAGETSVFQGLLLDRTHDADDLSSELTRHLRAAARAAALGPEARLLGERPYAPSGRVRRVVLDPGAPGDAAVQVEHAAGVAAGADALASGPAGEPNRSPWADLFDGPVVEYRRDAAGHLQRLGSPLPSAPEADPDETHPRRPTQYETRRLEPLTALRFIARAEARSRAGGEGPVEVSRVKLAEMIRSEGLTAPGNIQLDAALRALSGAGVLVPDGRYRRLAFDAWSEARDALLRADRAGGGPDAEDAADLEDDAARAEADERDADDALEWVAERDR